MAGTFLTAVLSFISTNIDDLFILMIFCAQARNSRDFAQIAAGHYAGIGLLTAVSILGALGIRVIPSGYLRLLGFFPLLLGIKASLACRRGEEEAEKEAQAEIRFLPVALVTAANGGDNIGVYIPIFSGYRRGDFAVTLAVFTALAALWCCLGWRLASYPYMKRRLIRYQHILVPTVLVGLGAMILLS